MGKNPKNSSDDDYNFNIQSLVGSIGDNQIWKKEFFTSKNEEGETNITSTGDLNVQNAIVTYKGVYSGGHNFV